MTYRSPAWLIKAPEPLRPTLDALNKHYFGISGGALADFDSVDLTGIDAGLLHIAAKRGALFTGATVFGVVQTQEPLRLFYAPWDVLITDTHALLGCQPYEISYLPNLTDEEILALDVQVDNQFAVGWWAENKTAIIAAANNHIGE